MAEVDIFVVDDEHVIAHTLTIILRQAGYRVEVFHDPHAALMAMSRAPRLVLTDHNMPRLSGCSMASLFAITDPKVAILLFSGELTEWELEWRMLHRQSASSRLLNKPLHPSDILSAIQDAIGEGKLSKTCVPKMTKNRPTEGKLLDAEFHWRTV